MPDLHHLHDAFSVSKPPSIGPRTAPNIAKTYANATDSTLQDQYLSTNFETKLRINRK